MMSRETAGGTDNVASVDDDDDELYCTVKMKGKGEEAAGGSDRWSLCSKSGSGGRLDEQERNTELLSPRRWLICRVGAARRQSQTKLCQSLMKRPKTASRGWQGRGYPSGYQSRGSLG